jgi:electron transfer flavoprotein beta subunit
MMRRRGRKRPEKPKFFEESEIDRKRGEPLKIVVCVKQTPDTAATVTVQDGEVSWGDSPLVLNPWDEYAVEEALLTKEKHGGEVIALSLGPEAAREALKQALAMGCDQAILINDPAFSQPDSLQTSAGLAAAIRSLGEVDLAFFGKQAVDSDTGITGSQVARRLGWASLNLVAAINELDPQAGTLVVERLLEEGRQEMSGRLPAVVTVVKEINEPRYPSFMGIRKASRAEIPTRTAEQLGLSDIPEAVLSWPKVIAPPKVETECEFIEGDSPQAKAQQLVRRLVEEKVI